MKRRALTMICVFLLSVSVAVGVQNKNAPRAEKARDPVCGLMVDKDPNLSADYQGQTYYFCTKADRDKFRENPQRYVKGK
jgi:YHS domain-containing protein